ncbi:MAG: GNAT family N-acetyltransferase [Microthrixaceae bacterium]
MANVLLDAAAAWLRGQGRSAMRGPLSFTMTDEVGVLIDGFGDMPRIMMPYNHPYYPDLLEAYGLAKAMDLYAYHLDMKKLYGGTPEGTATQAHPGDREAQAAGQVHRPQAGPEAIRRGGGEGQRHLHRGLGETGARWVLPTTSSAHYAAAMKPAPDPDLAFFIEIEGKPVGVALCLPDANLVLKKMNGHLFPFGFIQALRYQKKISWVRVWALGVLPDYRHLGVEAVMIYEIATQAMRKGMLDIEASWVLENNIDARKSVEGMGAETTKPIGCTRRGCDA